MSTSKDELRLDIEGQIYYAWQRGGAEGRFSGADCGETIKKGADALESIVATEVLKELKGFSFPETGAYLEDIIKERIKYWEGKQ